jgi:Predicted signal transduction protein with a C-terminal ATPase domain
MKIKMHLHFHNKLFLYISGIIISLSLLYIVIFSSYIYQNLLKESKINLNQITIRTAADLETLFTDMDKLSLYISTNPDVTHAFSMARQENYDNHRLSQQISTILTSISIPNNSSRFRINLMNRNGNFISTGIPYSRKITNSFLNSQAYIDWYYNIPILHNNSNFTTFRKDIWSNSKTLYLSLYREIFDSAIISKVLGVIEVQCPYYIVDSILSFEAGENNAYLFDQTGHLIYSAKSDETDAATLYQSFQKHKNEKYAAGTYNGFLYSGVYLENGWVLVLTQYQKQIQVVLKTFILFVIILGFSTLIICLGITFIVTKRSTKPLRELTDFAKQVTLDNLSLDMDYTEYPDEVINLNHAFQTMLERLKVSMDKNVEMKTYEIRANMIALQSQIDPHFLYNILTVIKAMSRENKSSEIGSACNYLVDMLRYTSDYKEELVSLETEIKNANCYLSLMKLRYEDQFTYEYQIASNINTAQIMVPKLIIQPVLENCFQHGFKKVLPPWNISIRCWFDNEKYYIEIADNGAGISEESIALLNQKLNDFLKDPSNSIASLKIGGMGLINTFARLKLRYNDDVVLEISSLSKGGTRVLLGGIFHEYITG